MKRLYFQRLSLRVRKSLLLAALFFCASYASNAQIYYATLSGPNEATPNNSPGTGKAIVTIAGNTMRVQTTFSGLLGTTTASHMHAPTPAAGAGAAGVATTLPTFPGFPLGVTAGTYDQTLNMTLASSYNPAYITANGGTPALAFAAFKAAVAAGKSYLNIHTTSFPGGEIRGFLIACPTINVALPDAFALTTGALPNTVYPAYAPASSLLLTAAASGGTGPYTYTWSNAATTSAITVRPLANTTYSVTVQDQNGCQGSATKTVKVMDISGGKKGDKINICHMGRNTLTIAAPAVADHLEHGDMLGSCSDAAPSVTLRDEAMSVRRFGTEAGEMLSVKALPNPSFNEFNVQLNGSDRNGMQIRVFDLLGRTVETRTAVQPNQTLRLGNSYKPGIYLVEVIQGTERQTLKLVKNR